MKHILKFGLFILLLVAVTAKADIYLRVSLDHPPSGYTLPDTIARTDVRGAWTGSDNTSWVFHHAGGGDYYMTTFNGCNVWTDTEGINTFNAAGISSLTTDGFTTIQSGCGNDMWILTLHWAHTDDPPPCTTNLTWSVPNSYGEYRIFAVSKDGTAFEGSQTVGAAENFNYTKNDVPCGQAAEWHVYVSRHGDDSMEISTNGTGSGVNTNLPNLYPDNSSAVTNMNLWTGTNLAQIYTNSPAIWTNITADIGGIIGASTQGLGQVVGSLGGNGLQAHSDSTNLDKQLIANSQQATADANGIIDAVNKVRLQAHSDANGNGSQAHTDAQSIKAAIQSGATNRLGNITNYATESTLAGLSNSLFADGVGDTNFGGAFDTNYDPLPTNLFGVAQFGLTGSTNYDQALAETAISDVAAVETDSKSYVSGFTDFTGGMDDNYAPVDMTYTIDYGQGSKVMDFDPLHNDSLLNLFSLAKLLFAWSIAALYLQKITTDGFKLVLILNSAHGVSPQAVTTELKK